jgi:hypothetical protein
MRRLAVLLAAVGMLAVPITAAANPGRPHVRQARSRVPRTVARHACRTERTRLGRTAFKSKYGSTRTLSNCVTSKVPAARTATKACRAERRQVGPSVFRARYPAKNAIRACVRHASVA